MDERATMADERDIEYENGCRILKEKEEEFVEKLSKFEWGMWFIYLFFFSTKIIAFVFYRESQGKKFEKKN